MTADDTKTNGAPERTPKPKVVKKDLNILMLHGYTQSGPLFRSKTRALEKLLAKALTPLNLNAVCHYPTGPLRLDAKEIPGYTPPEGDAEDEGETDSWAWFRKRDDPQVPGGITYIGLDSGMNTVAEAIRGIEGGVDGVIGFSQGGAMTALVASVLETPHREVPEASAAWATDLREANGGRGLKFAGIYSGFFATDEALAWTYEPKIQIPSVHFIGSLDTVVEESRSQALVERFEDPVIVVHPGGHYVPISKEWAMALAGFVQRRVKE
ncbi:dihydrofolate reductase [Plectosphaerella plurivora]|uniref:Dihydrofolate reductase n=1 Tax=Plectosphaerella plurivora TaxID=936078 RepID=A0A9P9A8N2_9PEZI|nr:dihydrofolate reductase [Plectosphaerella plurivora]